MTEARPWLVVVGGINGAGKSTFAESLAQDPSLVGAVFLNPDHAISAVLAADPSKSRRAADFGGLRAVSLELGRLLAARKSLIVETVFANEAYFRLIRRARGFGYAVRLVFVGTLRSRTPSDASPPGSRRAAAMTSASPTFGGVGTIAHTNLARAVPMVDEVLVLSNSGYGAKPAVVAVAKAGEITLLEPNALPAVTAVLVPLIGP